MNQYNASHSVSFLFSCLFSVFPLMGVINNYSTALKDPLAS